MVKEIRFTLQKSGPSLESWMGISEFKIYLRKNFLWNKPFSLPRQAAADALYIFAILSSEYWI